MIEDAPLQLELMVLISALVFTFLSVLNTSGGGLLLKFVFVVMAWWTSVNAVIMLWFN